MERLAKTFKDPRLYGTILYTFLMFPLGTLYFCVLITLFSLSLWFIAAPVLHIILWERLHIPTGIPAPLWFQFLLVPLGVLLFIWSLHLVNLLGYAHGKLSRALLIRW
jgi:hypothetical protein